MGLGDHIMALGELEHRKREQPGDYGFGLEGRGEFVFPLGARSRSISVHARQRKDWNAIQSKIKASGRFVPFDPASKERVTWIDNVSGNRRYVKRARSDRFVFQREVWPRAGHLAITDAERDGAPHARVLIGDTIKGTVSGSNKQWGKWDQLCARLREIGEVTAVFAHSPVQSYGIKIRELDVWKAIAVVASADLVVTNEGFLHHVAASFGVPCIVVAGGYTAQDVTGYRGQLWLQDGEACGSRGNCDHCRRAMAKISVDQVFEAARTMLEKGPTELEFSDASK